MLTKQTQQKSFNDYIELSKYIYAVLYNFIFEYPKCTAHFDTLGCTNINVKEVNANRKKKADQRAMSFSCFYQNCYIIIEVSITITPKKCHDIYDNITTNFEIFDIGKNTKGNQNRAFYTNLFISQIYFNRKKYFKING